MKVITAGLIQLDKRLIKFLKSEKSQNQQMLIAHRDLRPG